MPSKRLSNKSFERDASRLRVLMNNDFGGGLKPDFIQVVKIYDATTPQWVWTPTTAAQLEMVDSVESSAMGLFMVPSGYSGSITINAVFHMDVGTNNIVIQHFLYHAVEGESNTANIANYNSGSNYTYTPSNTNIKVEFPITFTASGSDFVQLYFKRRGTDVSDTSAGHIRVWGWKVTYS